MDPLGGPTDGNTGSRGGGGMVRPYIKWLEGPKVVILGQNGSSPKPYILSHLLRTSPVECVMRGTTGIHPSTEDLRPVGIRWAHLLNTSNGRCKGLGTSDRICSDRYRLGTSQKVCPKHDIGPSTRNIRNPISDIRNPMLDVMYGNTT